ncbi:MAG: site-specific DNA-methyltransferase [Pseudomonadota bacterium]
MGISILIGDVFERLADIADESVDCVVTSPPYWGLRDYGVEGQIGLEPTLGEHLATMVKVFAEIRRVLKPTGTVWLNYGDCYATTPNGRSAADTKAKGDDDRGFVDKPFSTIQGALKPKDLCMLPARLAIALQEDGWWIRSEIIWGKPNPMPESIKDRPATAHEKIYLMTKAPKYAYDHEAVRQPAAEASISRWSQNIEEQAGSDRSNGGRKTNGPLKVVGGPKKDKQRGHGRRHEGFNARWDAMSKDEQQASGRSLRNYEPAPVEVWKMATRPFKEAHFATFPPELAERCIKAGCPQGGHVLDPFGGAGTTGLVASRLGRSATLIELNPEYAEIARKRIADDIEPIIEAVQGGVTVEQLSMDELIDGAA